MKKTGIIYIIDEIAHISIDIPTYKGDFKDDCDFCSLEKHNTCQACTDELCLEHDIIFEKMAPTAGITLED